MRTGFTKISQSIFNISLKPLDLVVYTFYQSHKAGFHPSFKYTRRVLKIHLHTLKQSLERIKTALQDQVLHPYRVFFVPHSIFDLDLSRSELAILIYSFSLQPPDLPSHYQLRQIFGMSFANISRSLARLIQKGLLVQNKEALSSSSAPKKTHHYPSVSLSLPDWTVPDIQYIACYYEFLRYKIGEHYHQGWDLREVSEWKVWEIQELLGQSTRQNQRAYSRKEICGVLGLKALVLLKDEDTALKMSSAFEVRYLLSPKNLSKNLMAYYRYKESKDYTVDDWYIHTHWNKGRSYAG